MIAQHELVMHFIVDHDMKGFDAENWQEKSCDGHGLEEE